jgi:hypothetical protein
MDNDVQQIKLDRAAELVDEGLPNLVIHERLKQELGSSVSTGLLAEFRATKPERAKAVRQMAAKKLRTTKRALVKQMLAEGKSGYACQQACKKIHGTGIGHEVIVALRRELAEEAGIPPGAILPVVLPPEMVEEPPPVEVEPWEPDSNPVAASEPETAPEPSEAVSLAIVPPEGPNGTLRNMQAIQKWMVGINADSMSLTFDGKLSVRVRHEFDIGGVG